MSAISRSCLIFISSILFTPEIHNPSIAWPWLLMLCMLLLIAGICMKTWAASLFLYLSVYSFGLLCFARHEYKSVATDRLIKVINKSSGVSNLLINKVGRTKKGFRLECLLLSHNAVQLSPLKISCLLYTPFISTDLQKADTLSLQIPFRKIKKSLNPVKFDKEAYYRPKGIFYEAYINTKKELAHKCFYPSSLHPTASARHQIAKRVKDLNLKKKTKAFIHALLLGDKSHMHSSTRESFADTGCIHVLAVSGLHTGIIFSLVSPLLCFLSLKHELRWLRFAIVSGLLYIFVSICGYPPSAVRASCMLSLWLFLKCLGKSYNAFSILSLTAFVVLMIQPIQINQLGFKFSYLALAGIITLYPVMPYGNNNYMQSIWASPLKMIWLSVCAQYFLTPLLLFEMNSFAPYFAISSMVAVPSIFIIMLLSIICILSHNFIPLINTILDLLTSSLIESIAYIEKWPLSSINDFYFTELAFGLSFVFLLILSISLVYRKKLILLCSFPILFSIIPCLQTQRLHQLHTASISIFHKMNGSLVSLHHNGREYIIYQSGKTNNEYLLSKLRTEHSTHYKNYSLLKLPVIIQSEKFRIMIADTKTDVCIVKDLPDHVDFLLLTQANKNKLHELMRCMTFEKLIIDGSTTYENKKHIIETIGHHGLVFHDTSTKGFWNHQLLNP